MSASVKLRAVVMAAFSASLLIGGFAIGAEEQNQTQTQGTETSFPDVQNLKAQIDALKTDRNMCRRENLRFLYDSVNHWWKNGALPDDEAGALGKKLDEFLLECKRAGLW